MSYIEVVGCFTVFTLYTYIKSQIYLTSPPMILLFYIDFTVMLYITDLLRSVLDNISV